MASQEGLRALQYVSHVQFSIFGFLYRRHIDCTEFCISCNVCSYRRPCKVRSCSVYISIYTYSHEHNITIKSKKSVPLQTWSGPTGYQEVKVPRFRDNGHRMLVGCQPCAPAAFTPRKYSWYSFLLEAMSTPGP